MKIDFACDSCGKSYSVKQELAGRKAKCKQCGQSIRVPGQRTETTNAAPATPRPTAPPNHTIPAGKPLTAAPVTPARTATTNPGSPDPGKKIMNAFPQDAASKGLNTAIPPDSSHRLGDTMASNPGNIKVSKLRYIRVYPKWFLIWHGLLIISALLSWYSLWFIPLLLLIALCTWMYWNRIKSQFMHGCTNPALIISLDPPLIATSTNLTKGGADYPTIKVAEQPIHKMSTGKPTTGQRIATIALYEDRYEQSDHWSSFDPKPVACVSSNQAAIQRVFDSIDKEDWDELQQGINQIPKPIKPGHYRIYKQEDLGTATMSPAEIRKFVTEHMGSLDYVYTAGEFTPIEAEKMQEATEYLPPGKLTDVWCLIESAGMSGGCKFGMAFGSQGIFFNFKDAGKGHILYSQLAAAFSSDSGIEILLRDGNRIYFDRGSMWADVLGTLDAVIDVIAGRSN